MLQHLNEEGLGSDHFLSGLSNRSQGGTCRTTRGNDCRRRKGPTNWDLSHLGDSRRPRGLPPWEFGGVRLVPLRYAGNKIRSDCPRPECRPRHEANEAEEKKVLTERVEAVAVEVEKLLKAQFIRAVYYPNWLANVVLVKKSNGKWRMCVDFTDLNKAYPKDSFPLPRIDTLVDSTSGYELLSFMDAFSGYNQILMHPEDQEKTSFITDRGLYCYKVMPFGLKNAGATYQRLVNKMFQGQIGRNMEVYVDDMLVKSTELGNHAHDLHEAFETLKQYGMKLNPVKCAFRVSSRKFLGYMVSSRGMEANPEKIQAILEMQSPKTTKQL